MNGSLKFDHKLVSTDLIFVYFCVFLFCLYANIDIELVTGDTFLLLKCLKGPAQNW